MNYREERHGMEEKAKISEERLKEILEEKAKTVSEEDIERLIADEDSFERKVARVPGAFNRMVNQLKLLFEMIKDYWNGNYKEVPWLTIATIVAAVIYFINPFDLVPDFIPGIGFVDDALVISLAIRAIQKDLEKYCIHRGLDPAQYF
ncbi:MAG TPA: DUF1232 domain-containing protein [Proteobacteria bacterium]|nr:DUF1232 domain-containing protein [Pseudomonadota bacterium]